MNASSFYSFRVLLDNVWPVNIFNKQNETVGKTASYSLID